MKQGCISAIVPVYNTDEALLTACVESMLRQSYTESEIILVDDGSSGKTARLCDSFAIKDKRVTIIHQENAGPAAARNKGLQRATGEYLSFVDSDDILHQDAWETAIRGIEEQHADCAVFGWRKLGAEKSSSHAVSDGIKLITVNEAQCRIAADDEDCGGGYPWNKVWNAESIRSNNNGQLPAFDEELFVFEDKEWVLRVLSGLDKLVLIPDILYDYRYLEGSMTNATASWEKRQYNAYAAYDKILAYLKDRNTEAWHAALDFYFRFCVKDTFAQHLKLYKYGIRRARRTRQSLCVLCSRIHAEDLKHGWERVVWMLVKLCGQL